MKNYFLATSLILMCALFFNSCTKEEPLKSPEIELADEMLERAGPALPDLVITAYGSSNIPTTSTDCGPVLPNVGCNGPGGHGFQATIIVANIGNRDVPAGSVQINWVDLTLNQNQPLQMVHPGIPAGRSVRFSRTYFLGPCDCVPPYTAFTHSFMAGVNGNGAIPESNYANNRSPQFDTCDGC